MLSVRKLKELCQERQVDIEQLAGQLARGGLNRTRAAAALKNWRKGLLKPIPGSEDVRRLATALSVEENELSDWHSSYRYAPISARKARLVTALIVGRGVQEALDILKFTRKRAASMIEKVLKSAVADADDQQADVVSSVRKILKEASPDAEEAIKWAQPVYSSNGPFAYIKAFKNSVNFGFWRGVELNDPKGLLQGSGDKMRHVKLTSPDDIDATAFDDFIVQAVQLNLTKGDPTKG